MKFSLNPKGSGERKYSTQSVKSKAPRKKSSKYSNIPSFFNGLITMDRKVSTANLKPGMYVSRLDRPWMTTPFMIQGFFIEDHADIAKLVRYCDFVYIDTDMGETAEM